MSEALKAIRKFKESLMKDLLDQCTEKQIDFFKRIFSHKEPDISLDRVLQNMPEKEIEGAIALIERTIESNKRKETVVS